MTKLGVNIDHSATLRQARYRESLDNPDVIVEPNPAEIALAAERGGAAAGGGQPPRPVPGAAGDGAAIL